MSQVEISKVSQKSMTMTCPRNKKETFPLKLVITEICPHHGAITFHPILAGLTNTIKMNFNSSNKDLILGFFFQWKQKKNLITNNSPISEFSFQFIFIIWCHVLKEMEIIIEIYLIFSKVFLLVTHIIQINKYICTIKITLILLMDIVVIVILCEIGLNC